jgi:hypothetical protein
MDTWAKATPEDREALFNQTATLALRDDRQVAGKRRSRTVAARSPRGVEDYAWGRFLARSKGRI